MFVLAEFKDAISVKPKHFTKPKLLAIEDEINAKYANRVFHNVGLCICVHDIVETGDGVVQHSDGSAYYKVRFRMVVFRPFPGQILVGNIKSSSPQGVRVSLNFFEDILVPPTMLPSPRRFDEDDKVWIWDYQGTPLYLDDEEPVRLQLQSIQFKEIRPDAAKRPEGSGDQADPAHAADAMNAVPFQIIADMTGPGLGPLSWWQQSE